ncbi:10562_t:CDS:2, partial [Funneliformis geosporum]
MLSENQSSSDNAEGSGTLIHHEQSEETLNLDDVGSTEMNKLHDPQQPSQSESTTNAEPDTIKGGLFKGIKTFFVKEVEEVSNVPSVKEKSKGIASMFKKGDKSKDDEKDKGEPADKKKK